ncbi:MAG: hypothetical protein WBV71_09325, partial [Roseobacter sp.]
VRPDKTVFLAYALIAPASVAERLCPQMKAGAASEVVATTMRLILKAPVSSVTLHRLDLRHRWYSGQDVRLGTPTGRIALRNCSLTDKADLCVRAAIGA